MVDDYPTQSRLYLATDFDYLVLGMDPPIVDMCKRSSGLSGGLMWEFYLIPSNKLELHHSIESRFKSLQKFTYSGLQEYKIVDWFRAFS